MNLHSTGDTYNFSTKPICPNCGREIPTDNIVADKDSAWCPACQREMSFTDVADYSLVKTVRKDAPPKGLTVLSDSGGSLRISFKSARIGLRLFGVIFSIAMAIPIPWIAYHMAAGHCKSYLVASAAVTVLSVIEVWLLLSLRNEFKLHMVFQFGDGLFSYSIHPTFFKFRPKEYAFGGDSTFGFGVRQLHIYSPQHQPVIINIPFPISPDQLFYLHACLLDFQLGISAGKFKVHPPQPNRKCPQMVSVPVWKVILHWLWAILVVAILVIRIALIIIDG